MQRITGFSSRQLVTLVVGIAIGAVIAPIGARAAGNLVTIVDGDSSVRAQVAKGKLLVGDGSGALTVNGGVAVHNGKSPLNVSDGDGPLTVNGTVGVDDGDGPLTVDGTVNVGGTVNVANQPSVLNVVGSTVKVFDVETTGNNTYRVAIDQFSQIRMYAAGVSPCQEPSATVNTRFSVEEGTGLYDDIVLAQGYTVSAVADTPGRTLRIVSSSNDPQCHYRIIVFGHTP